MPKEIFQRNRECIILIPETVSLLRRQMYFEGGKRVKVLIKNVSEFTDYILKSEFVDEMKQEWMLILQAFLSAQENKDYILMADILEGDMFVFLEKLQSILMTDDSISVESYLEENLQVLQEVKKDLYKKLLADSEDVSKQSTNVQYEPQLAINGQPTLKVQVGEKSFCMHSTVNPEWEAKELANSWLIERKAEYQIFGMGMGHHIKALLDADENIRVTVLEYRVESLMLALTYIDWTKYLVEGRLHILYESDILKLLKKMKEKSDFAFFLHHPSLECVEEKEVKEMLEDYFIKVSTMMEQGKSLDQNFEFLQKQNLPCCDVLRDIFAQKNVVITAGGPSLDDEIDSLKKYRDNLTILSVGTVAKKLLEYDIRPDAIIITDPQDTMYQQIVEINAEDIPMILLSTASKTIVKHYKGPIYLAYQYGYEPAEKVANEKGYSLFQTGGSVTTTALDVAITFGANKIVLVGADMAYTDNRSHTSGAGLVEKDFSDYRQVTAVGGGVVYTTRNLDIYRKWIENRIADLKIPVVYNTGRGARIKGTVEKKLRNIFEE